MIYAARVAIARAASRQAKASQLSNTTARHPMLSVLLRHKSTAEDYKFALDENGNVPERKQEPAPVSEVISFPGGGRAEGDSENEMPSETTIPVLLNAKEHVVGYLSRILNARVYDAAIETDLQHARNLSAVRISALFWLVQGLIVESD